jgi:hypothetical protein
MLNDLILLILQDNMQKHNNKEISETAQLFIGLANQKLVNMLKDQKNDFSDILKLL